MKLTNKNNKRLWQETSAIPAVFSNSANPCYNGHHFIVSPSDIEQNLNFSKQGWHFWHGWVHGWVRTRVAWLQRGTIWFISGNDVPTEWLALLAIKGLPSNLFNRHYCTLSDQIIWHDYQHTLNQMKLLHCSCTRPSAYSILILYYPECTT